MAIDLTSTVCHFGTILVTYVHYTLQVVFPKFIIEETAFMLFICYKDQF